MKERIAREFCKRDYGDNWENLPKLTKECYLGRAAQILSLIREEIEKVENPYYIKVADGAYNQYPEFGVWDECRQMILKALES